MDTGQEGHIFWRGFGRTDTGAQDVRRRSENIAGRRRLIPGRTAGLANPMLVRPDSVRLVCP
jgi:hypothetical protein